MPFKTKIQDLTRKAAEISSAWKGNIQTGEADAAEQNRLEAVKVQADLLAVTEKQKQHEDMEVFARAALEPSGTPLRVSDLPTGGHVALEKMDRQVVLNALSRGVDKAVKIFSLTDGERAALTHAARVHDQAFRAYIGSPSQRQGERIARELMEPLPPVVKNEMWTTEGDKGGFLAPPQYVSQPIENRIKPGVIRTLARVEPTKGDLKIPVVKQPTANKDYLIGDFTGTWTKEGNRQSNEQVLAVDQVTIPTHEWQGYWVPITEKLMKNAGANVADIVARVIVAAANFAEEVKYWTGSGIGEPQGLLRTGNTIVEVNSKDANLLTYKGVRNLHFALRTPYRDNGTYVMNSHAYGDVLGLESTGGFLVFPPNALPNTLFNRPVMFWEGMDDVAANKHPIVFGDFQEGYIIAEDTVLRIIRSDEKFLPQIGFLPTMTVGGLTVQEAAFVQQKIAA